MVSCLGLEPHEIKHADPSQRDYFIATAAVYVPSLIYLWLRTCFEHGLNLKARVSVEESGTISISIPVEFDWIPGQHCFLRFHGLGWQAFSSHPFSICSLPSRTLGERSSAVFYARHRGGLTARLYHFAKAQPRLTGVSIDGPYGGIDLRKFHACDRMLIIAGGSAAGWTLPFIEQFARLMTGSTEDDAARPRSMRVILATRDDNIRHWFLQAVRQALSHRSPPESSLAGLSIEVYLTGDDKNVATPPEDLPEGIEGTKASFAGRVQEFKSQNVEGELYELHNQIESQQRHGRPNLQAIIREEAANAANLVQSVGVFICGPPLMLNDVRNTVAAENWQILQGSNLGGFYLYCEHYSWA